MFLPPIDVEQLHRFYEATEFAIAVASWVEVVGALADETANGG
jgi:hypothetical protein